MPEVRKIGEADLVVLYTNIGRGHPSYLDGIVEFLDRSHQHIKFIKCDVFEHSRGISLKAWNLVRKLYFWGARGGLVTSIYGVLRQASGSGEGGSLAAILGRDVKKLLAGFGGPVIVAHPILAAILAEQNRVIYQHGELAVPQESVVKRCRTILVPLEQTAREFIKAGIERQRLIVTGQCIETDLAAHRQSGFNRRISRLEGDAPLKAALFSSGAYPRQHLRKIRLAAVSLFKAGHEVLLFAGSSKAVTSDFIHYFERQGIEVGIDLNSLARLKVLYSPDRLDENRSLAAVFDSLDFFMAPAHERTNWAIGLGLPFFILKPHIGSYAPLNAAIALGAKVACSIDNDQKAAAFGEVLGNCRREGELISMARNGFGRTRLSGFERSAEVIADLISKG